MKFADLMNVSGNLKDCMQIKKQADEIRSSICSYDNSLLNNNNNLRIDIGNLSDVPDGRFVIPYNGIDFDCLFKRKVSSEKLYVFFSGYRAPGRSEPTFKRWSYYNYIDANMLNIDDPMCKLYPKLGLGWYYGTEDECYCDYIVDIVNEFCTQNGFKEIIFFASSAGGYAALYCACKIKGSTAIAVNPQIRLCLYTLHSGNFEKITGLNLTETDRFRRNNLPELIVEAKESKFILIENSASDVDMIQLNDLCATINTNYHYGLTQLAPNILSWVYEGNMAAAHNAQEYFAVFFAIKFLAEHFNNAIDYSEIYLIFSELWNDHYDLIQRSEKDLQQRTRRVEFLSSVSDPFSETVTFKTVVNISGIDIQARDVAYNFFCRV